MIDAINEFKHELHDISSIKKMQLCWIIQEYIATLISDQL